MFQNKTAGLPTKMKATRLSHPARNMPPATTFP